MSITSTNSSVTASTSITPQQEEADIAAISLESFPEVASTSETMGLKSFAAFGLSGAALGEPTPYTIDDLGPNLITFSKLSEAQKWAGDDVTTLYFRKYVENGITYLEPLKAVRSGDVSYSSLAANKLTYVSAGAPIVYSATLPTSAEYLKLHSSEQIALAALNGQAKVVPHTPPRTGNLTYSELIFAADANTPQATVVLSQDSSKIYIVEKLQARDIAIMSFENQLAISTTAAFETAKVALGLTGTRTEALKAVQDAIDNIMTRFPDVGSKSIVYTSAGSEVTKWEDSDVTFVGGNVETVTDGQIGFFKTEHRDLFLKQLELLKEEILTDNAVFNLTPLNDKIAVIGERFNRAYAFGNIPINLNYPDDPTKAVEITEALSGFRDNYPTNYVSLKGYSNLISQDNNKTVKEGFDLFIAQEKIYYENAQSRRDLITSIQNNNMTLDAPTLLYRLQMHYNIASAADISCASEELRQQNDLLNSYAKAQQLISQTVAANKKTILLNATPTKSKDKLSEFKDNDGKQTIGGKKLDSIVEVNYWDEQTIKDISMFQTHNGGKDVLAPLHPLEILRNIKRPRISILGEDGNDRHGTGWAQEISVTGWQQTANQFADTVNLLSQETQNVLNKISGYEKDKGRYTDMASNTLSKLLDALTAIGRSL